MKPLSDRRIIRFLADSPLHSISAMLDALRYLDGQRIWEDLEYELFDDALGDNSQRKQKIRVPSVRGITANVFLNFTRFATKNHMVRRRSRKMRDFDGKPDEVVVFYEVTPAGRKMINILESIDAARNEK
jgi:hypothetical protein